MFESIDQKEDEGEDVDTNEILKTITNRYNVLKKDLFWSFFDLRDTRKVTKLLLLEQNIKFALSLKFKIIRNSGHYCPSNIHMAVFLQFF